MKLTKEGIKQLQIEIAEALHGVSEKYDLLLEVGSSSYNSTSVTTKVIFKNRESDKDEFVKYCQLYNLKPEDFGKTFNKDQNKIIGLNMNRRKYAIRYLEISTGRIYNCRNEYIQQFGGFDKVTL